jgi:cysteine synthase
VSGPAVTALDAMCDPPVVRLGDRVHCVAFPLMKVIPARHMIECAWRSGELHSGSCVVETTSGTLGLGLALVCAARGLPLILVTDAVVDLRLRMRLEYLGARVEIVRAAGHSIQDARLGRVREIVASDPARYYWPRQYDNPANRASYAPLARRVRDVAGRVDLIVGSVGSGGSACGIAESIRQATPQTRLIGIDTHGSILFGLPPGPRALRGLGNSVMPANLQHHYFDEVHWVTAELAHGATRALYREHGLYMGPTSGAAYLVGTEAAARHPGQSVLLLFPDDGHRYADDVYQERYLPASHDTGPAGNGAAGNGAAGNGTAGTAAAGTGPGPRFAASLREASEPGWTAVAWRRRTLAEMLAAQPASPAGNDHAVSREENRR